MNNTKTIYLILFLLAVVLRIFLASYGTTANDNHKAVVDFIIEKDSIPAVKDCWQCYHPKLYHYTSARLIQGFNIKSPLSQVHLMEFLNVLAGIFTICIFYKFLSKLHFHDTIKIIAFALFALNPRFCGINSQGSNDSFAILFATMATYYLWCYFKKGSIHYFSLASLGTALAIASKGSGLVFLIATPIVLVITQFFTSHSLPTKKIIIQIALFIVFIGTSFYTAGYYRNYEKTGTPFALNLKKDAAPNFFKPTMVSKGGVVSIADAFGTFRIIDLLYNPIITKSSRDYPKHRNSFFTQLFSRNAFTRTESYPSAWKTTEPMILLLGRLAFAFSLVPLLFLIIGSISTFKDMVLLVLKKQSPFSNGNWILFMVMIGMLLLTMQLAISYRNHFTMKAIYFYPALLSIYFLFMKGLQAFFDRTPSIAHETIKALSIILCLIYISDSFALSYDLSRSYHKRAAQYNKNYIIETVLTDEMTRLDTTLLSSIDQSYSKLKINKSHTSKPLTINGQLYKYGFGTHASSTLTFALNKKFNTLNVGFGMDDQATSSDGARFRLLSDNKVLYLSEVMWQRDIDYITVDISDTDTLRLETIRLANGRSDHANWINPVLTIKDDN